MKPKYYPAKLRNLNLGASLVTLITVCFSGAALAATWDGTGTVVTDWNDNGNWVGDNGTGGSNAVINISSPVATISANIVATPVDIFVGAGAGGNGRLDHLAGTAQTGGGNWMAVGRDGATGIYNLANTAGTGGVFTGMAQGSGSMNVGGRLYIGGQGAGDGGGAPGGPGTVNVNTTGTLAIGQHLEIGTNSSTGTLNIDGGTVTTGNWTEIGNGVGCTGTLNMSGGKLTKTGPEHLIVGANGANGFANITGGALDVNNEIWVGNGGGSNGKLTFSAGTITNNSWVAIGRLGGTLGTLEMSGGTWNKTGGGQFIVADGATGVAKVSGGTININNDVWVGEGGAANGTLEISGAGTIVTNGWVAIGRSGGTGTVKVTGGTWTKNNDTRFIIGANGPGSMTVSNGLVDVAGGFTWIGEAPGATTASLTISDLGEFRTSIMSVGPESPNASLNLNGGTLRVVRFSGNREQDGFNNTGNGTINFNGTQIILSGSSTAFTNQVDNLNIASGGMKVNTNGFNAITNQGFPGAGGVVKSGAGTLTLNGVNSYAGTNTVAAGKLVLNGDSTGTGAFIVANGATLGIKQNTPADSLDSTAATFGTAAGATTLDLDLGNTAGNPTAAPLRITGGLTLNGLVTVNVADLLPAVGTIPLISYTGAKSGGGSFTLGALPEGVAATMTDNGTGLVSLNVTSALVLTWTGGSSAWDNGTPNWTNLVTNAPANFANTASVKFDDTVGDLGSTSVELNQTVAPSAVLFNNSSYDYNLSGSGKITGATPFRKAGTSSLSISTVNDYTGVTRLEGGFTTVDTLTNGGVASPLGAATGAASNLVLAGGTLDYIGGNVSINRGFTVAGVDNTVISGLNLAGNVTTTGQVSATVGKLVKSGSGTLTLSGTGANVLANGGGDPQAFRVDDGGMVFNGAGQTNTVTGGAAFGTGAGTTAVTFANGASLTSNGRTSVAPGANSTATLTVSGTSALQLNDAFQIAITNTSVGNVIVQDSGSINKVGGWFSVGNDGTGTMTVRNSGTVTADGDFNVGDVGSASGTINLENSGKITTNGPIFIGKNGTTGVVNMTDLSTFSANARTEVGGGTGSHGTLNVKGSSVYTATQQLLVGPGGGSSGSVIVEGNGSLVVNNFASVGYNGGGSILVKGSGIVSIGDDLSINENGDVPAIVTVQDNAAMSVAGTVFIGRNAGRVGTLTVSGTSTFSQTNAAASFRVSDSGPGTLNIQGTATVNIASTAGVAFTVNAGNTGTVNLDGGTLVTKKLFKGAGNGTFKFNGGVLKAGTGADLAFMNGLTTADVYVPGAFIDTNGQTIAIGQALGNQGGGLTKQGSGTLLLNGTNTYVGATTVSSGTLGGTGSVAGSLLVPSGSSVAPGASNIGTLTAAGATTIGGTYVCEVQGTTADSLAVGGLLTISPGSTLDFNALATTTAPVIVIATYGSRSGTFTNVLDTPSGYTVEYNYLGNNQIALVATGGNPYNTWASSFSLNPATDGAPGFDKDGDGQKNLIEYALGGSPISGSNNAKVFPLLADSSADVDAIAESLLTIAVRTGTPAFSNSASPSATWDGVTYAIEGSTTLNGFPVVVTPVTVVLPPAPNATPPMGYEYRTFSLSGSNGFTDKGFIRVKVSN